MTPSPSAARPRHSRSRLGCLTCRSRKKKCDQVKPRCAGCRRNQLACDWPDVEQAALVPARASAAAAAAARSSAAPPTVTFHIVAGPAPGLSTHAGPERPCSLTPQSAQLLGHYLAETADHFAMLPLKDNPFVTLLLPLACTDDLLMHAMLAFGGAHLAYKEPGSVDVATATELHYARLIAGLRCEFARLQESGGFEQAERLLRVLMVASHYEAISGDTQGAMFSHLRASRLLIASLLESIPGDKAYGSLDSLGFSIELYTFLSVNNMLTCSETLASPNLSPDPFVVPLEDMELFPTFGALFAGVHELYRLVPQVSRLASRRLAEEGNNAFAPPSRRLQAVHDDLHTQITSWTLPRRRAGETEPEWDGRSTAAEAFRQGLLIYLASAMGGSRAASDAAAMAAIRARAADFFAHAGRLQRGAAAHHTASLMWPTMIAGSCVVEAGHRDALARALRAGRYGMRHLLVLADVLRLLWDDLDPCAFGPHGLRLTMRKHGVSFGVV